MASWERWKSRCIDWTSVDEIICADISFNLLLEFHPRLRSRVDPNQIPDLVDFFNDPCFSEERRSVLQDWIHQGVFDLTNERWCSQCRRGGHSKLHCTVVPVRRRTILERLDDQPRLQGTKSADSTAPRKARFTPTGRRSVHSIDETWLKGTIAFYSLDREYGDVDIAGVGRVSFHVERCDFGMKKVGIGMEVKFRLETSGDRQMAVDVRPLQVQLTKDDVDGFIAVCDIHGRRPIDQMRLVLQRKNDWPSLVKAVLQFHDSPVLFVNTIVRMVTFLENREPVHRNVLNAFMRVLCSGDSLTSSRFFPDMFVSSLSPDSSVDVLLEASDFLLIMRCIGDAPLSDIKSCADRLFEMIKFSKNHVDPFNIESRKLDLAHQKTSVAMSHSNITQPLVPTAEEIAIPPHVTDAPLNARKLPDTAALFRDLETLVSAHLTLLRADVFYSTVSIIAHSCYNLGVPTPPSVAEDIAHTRRYEKLRLLGRAVPRDWEKSTGIVVSFSHVESKHSSKTIDAGQFVCVVTAKDRSRVQDDEIFWGVIGAVDPHLQAQNITVVFPMLCNADALAQGIRRNEHLGLETHLIETPVFILGYKPVAQALHSFLGPSKISLPALENTIVGGRCDERPVGYVAPHFRRVFDNIVADFRQRLTLDPGQDQALQKLRTSPCLLIQGPPGTGKSFIGSRIAEVFLRFKHKLKCGDALTEVNIDALQSCSAATLKSSPGPVLVITYKNHALDEFLVDLKRSGVWCGPARYLGSCACNGNFAGCCVSCCTHSSGIVRVGSGSAEPLLAGLHINDLLEASTPPRDVIQGRHRVAGWIRKIERLASEIRSLERGEISEGHWKEWLSDEQRLSLKREQLESWLAGEQFLGRDSSQEAAKEQGVTCPLSDVLEFRAEPVVETKPLVSQTDEDDGEETVFSKMKKETRQNDLRDGDAIRHTLISDQAVQLGQITDWAIPSHAADLQSLWSLNRVQRFNYLVFLRKRAISLKVREYLEACSSMEVEVSLLNHARDHAKLDLLRNADVIGMTTTGCALNQHILRSLRPTLLIVEEAAEILEGQLLACLSESIQQVVLIGDHYQLQPKVETMELQRANHFHISLFERLVTTATPIRLVEQRRMKPSISRLIRPFYEQQIVDHFSVERRKYVTSREETVDSIPGLARDVFLWTHGTPETSASVGRSKVNLNECALVCGLVNHLLNQSVRPDSIVIVTPYLGQRRLLVQEVGRIGRAASQIRIATVDRFQGDEGDVVILSLVRTQNMTEFLSIRNRMIVSCSRARYAMVIISNEDLLLKSPHWAQVVQLLRERDCVGPVMPLIRNQRTVDVSSQYNPNDWLIS